MIDGNLRTVESREKMLVMIAIIIIIIYNHNKLVMNIPITVSF